MLSKPVCGAPELNPPEGAIFNKMLYVKRQCSYLKKQQHCYFIYLFVSRL